MKVKQSDDPVVTKSILQIETTSLRVEMHEMEARIDDRARGYRDDVLTKMDQIVGELAQIREDRLFEKHEKREIDGRLTKLEFERVASNNS